jgi:transglutaminase-like putative cysteine protease
LRINVGYEITFDCPQPTPMILALNVHYSRISDLEEPDHIRSDPSLELAGYRDLFGNWITRAALPAGRTRLFSDTVVRDSGEADAFNPAASQWPVQDLPDDTLVYLLGSRYCETDRLVQKAWSMFGNVPEGWARVQAICDYVHGRIRFDYAEARATRTAFEADAEGVGVCRDFAHLALTYCRCMNIPARYCTGYLGDIGVPPDPSPMDFSGWFDVFLDGRWYTMDARHNTPRIGRILIGRGRDAADVAISTSFGSHQLAGFRVWTEEVTAE